MRSPISREGKPLPFRAFYASNCGCTRATISIKPSPVGEGGSTERLAEVETDEVFVTMSNFSLSLRRGGRVRGRRGVRDVNKLCLPAEGGGTSLASDGRSCVHKKLRCYTQEIYKPLCTHSPSPSFLGSSLRREPFVSLSRARKSADGCIEVRFFTPYSSVSLHSASSVCLPPSLTREGFCKSRFWATDGCAFVPSRHWTVGNLLQGRTVPTNEK